MCENVRDALHTMYTGIGNRFEITYTKIEIIIKSSLVMLFLGLAEKKEISLL